MERHARHGHIIMSVVSCRVVSRRVVGRGQVQVQDKREHGLSTVVARSPDDRREEGARDVVAGEARLEQVRAGIEHARLDLLRDVAERVGRHELGPGEGVGLAQLALLLLHAPLVGGLLGLGLGREPLGFESLGLESGQFLGLLGRVGVDGNRDLDQLGRVLQRLVPLLF
jgi:hypothetical protein